MYDPYAVRSKPRGRTNIASCFVATVFLLLLLVGGVVVYFLLFKPKPPTIAVDSVQFPNFSISNATVTFTFFQLVTVTNPNRDEFTHYDSSMQLVSSGQPVGLIFIPAGKIEGGRAQHMSAKFDVASYPLPLAAATTVSGSGSGSESGSGMSSSSSSESSDNSQVVEGGGAITGGPTMELETRMKLVGKVRVLKVFTHKVDSEARCTVVIEVSRGTVLGYHC